MFGKYCLFLKIFQFIFTSETDINTILFAEILRAGQESHGSLGIHEFMGFVYLVVASCCWVFRNILYTIYDIGYEHLLSFFIKQRVIGYSKISKSFCN